MKRIGYLALVGLAGASVCTGLIWAVGAIYYMAILPSILSAPLSVAYLAVILYLFFQVPRKRNWLSIAAASIASIYLISLLYQPSTDRSWDPDHQEMAFIDFQDGQVTVNNFRSNQYRTDSDYDVHFGEFQFPIDQLTDVWFLVQRFTPMEGMAHTFITFGLTTPQGPKYISVSVEIRREAGETYSPIRGLYRQYELIYVLGDEKDLIGVRTVMRPNDRVFMYRVNASAAQVQQLFREIAVRTNQLKQRPEFYNTLVNNCTNNIVRHTYRLTPEPINWLDPRIVLPGYSDRFAFAQGLIGQGQKTFEELATQSRIDPQAKRFGIRPGFSSAIRANPATDSD